VGQVGHLPELYPDARSIKHKILSGKLLTSYWKAEFYFRCSFRLHIDIDRAAHPDIFSKHIAEGLGKRS
jgi:hypothetical protein